MPAAGNTGGAGGARNVKRAQRRPRQAAPGPPSFPTYVPSKPGQIPKQAQRQVTLARALPKVAGPVREAPKRLQSPSAAQATSERKRAKRVELSATRKQTGGSAGTAAPIIVRRRADVTQETRRPSELKKLERTGQELGVLAKKPKPKVKAPPKLKTSGPTGTGVIGAVTAAAKFADKTLSGESVINKGLSSAANVTGKGLAQATTGDWYLNKLGLKRPKGGATGAVTKIIEHGGRDIVDIPAGVVPSFYVAGKENIKSEAALAKGDTKGFLKHQVKSARVFADPIVETVKHPRKSFMEHPVGTAAIFAGGEGALGRGGGALLRKGAAGKAGRRVARTERAPRTIPGTPQLVDRPYDPDVIRKGVQVAGEKVAARGRKKRGQPADRRMTTKDINRELNQDVRTGRNRSTLADEQTAIRVADAANPPRRIGPVRIRRKLRNKPVTAAHTVAVQGLAKPTKAGVEQLLADTKAAAKELSGDKLRKNQKRQAELEQALKQWGKGTEAHIRQTHERLLGHAPDEEAALIDSGVLDASRADANRFSTAATRPDIALHDPTTAADHVAEAGKEAARAGSAKGASFRRRLAKNAALREQIPKTRAAELGPRGKTRAGTTAAERDLNAHEKALQKAREQEAIDLAAARKELDSARHAAELTTKEISPTPEVLTTKARLDKANGDLAGLVRQASGRERVSGRQEGRAQEKVAAHERGRTAMGRRLAEEADRRQAELAVHNRTLAAVERAPERGARAYSPKQIEAVRKRRDLAQKRADAADQALTRHHSGRPVGAAEPAGLPSRERYIADRPQPARDAPTPTVERLTANLKPGKPGVSIESEHVVQRYRTGEPAGHGREIPGSKVVIARDAKGKPIGALHMLLDEHGKPTILEIAVDPAHRGKGLASQLVRVAHEAGYDVKSAAREGGLTEAGAALTHKNLAAEHAARPTIGRAHSPGTEPRGVLAAVERRGGEDLQLRQRILAVRAEVENALSEHARAQARAKGVPPKEADRLRKAITAHDNARVTFANRDSLTHLRDAVDVAKAKLAYEQSKGGLEPAAAERLWKAIHDAENATAEHTKAIADHEAAVARHRALKDAPYIDAKGVPHSVDEVRNHPARAGEPEPIFMPHAYEAAHSATPVNKVKAPNPQQRSGLAAVEGTSPVAGAQLTTARISRSKMITAARNRISFIDKWGYRDGVPVTEPATVYNTKGIADKAAGAAEKVTGHPMISFADQKTDGYVLVPKQTVEGPQGLQAHAENILHRDQLAKQLGRLWRTGVLSLSTRWLTGQAAEPVGRVLVAHQFNPVKLARSFRILSLTAKELKANHPQAFAEFEAQYKRGSLSRGVKVSRDEALQDFIMRDSAQGLEAAVRAFFEKPGLRTMHTAAGHYMRFWFHTLNGSIESVARRGLVGRELIKDPIIRDRKIALNFADAAKELAQGIADGPAANRFARNVDDSFGRYQGRSPQHQSIIENYTPFIPWFLSSMNFLYRVLPRDHPVLTGLAAAANQSTEEWRRKYGIYYDPFDPKMGVAGTETNLPLSRQGSIPVGKNNEDTINPTHYLPTSGVTSFGDLGGYLVPQLQDIMAASQGKDWRGYSLTGRDKPVNLDRIAKATIAAAITTLAPPAGVAAKLAGIHLPSEADLPAGETPPDTSERYGTQFNPLTRKPGLAKGQAEKKARRKAASRRANAKRRKKPGLTPLSGAGGSSGGLSLGGGSGGSGLKLGGG